MSSSGHGGGEGSGRSTPSKLGSLSASLTAHLTKPVAPSSPSGSTDSTVNHASIMPSHHQGLRLSPGNVHNGKAVAIATESASLINNNDVWRSSAARRAEKQWAIQSEKSLQSDVKFKKYALAVEKCLATFESVSEWADFISFLARLLKTLQTSTQYNAIPRKLIVAKRLSQCLNPALPSGVHQRALEVYEHIFTVIGPEGLRRDLSVWTPGLLPFFQYASMTVKPIVLNILELHYLPLGQDLRPIAKPMQLALLPGLEEETGEHFERVLKLLDKIRDSIGEPYFLQNLWLILISVPAGRLPSLHYLSRRLEDLNSESESSSSKEVTSIVGPDLGLAIRAFSAALEDDTLLVRRAMLDLLVVKFKLDSKTFQTLLRQDDRTKLVRSALAVVLRRDISLNRRLYAWLLGPSEDISAQQKYFEKYAIQYARLALLSDFQEGKEMVGGSEAGNKDVQRPYRILISLLDKWSLGLPITNALIIDTFKALRRQLEQNETNHSSSRLASSDISTTAKMLFEAVDPFALYRQFYLSICEELSQANANTKDSTLAQDSTISLLRFIFASFRVHDEESRVVHLPTLFATIMELIHQNTSSPFASDALQLARDILTLIPKRVFGNRISSEGDSTSKITSFYDHGSHLYQSSTSGGADEAAKRYIGFQNPRTISTLIELCSSIPLQEPSLAVESLTILCQLLNILDATYDGNQTQPLIPWNGGEWMQKMKNHLQDTQSFIGIEACIETFVAYSQCRVLAERMTINKANITPTIVEKLFDYMRPMSSPYHARSVELLWTVSDLSPSTQIGSFLTKNINSGSIQERQDAVEMFGVIWKYSEENRHGNSLLIEPLLSILDGLQSSDWNERQIVEAWVRNHVKSFTALIDPLLFIICDTNSHRSAQQYTIDGHTVQFYLYTRPLDHERVRYALSIMLQLVYVGGQSMFRSLRMAKVQSSLSNRLGNSNVEQSYTDFIVKVLILLLKSDVPSQSAYQSAHESIHALALDIIGAILGKVQIEKDHFVELENVLLQRLLVDVQEGVLPVQGKLLKTLHGILVHTRNVKPASVQQLSVNTPNSPPDLLLSALKAGLSASTNRAVLQDWSDFVLAITPIFRSSLNSLLLPLNQGLCALIRTGLSELDQAYGSDTQEDVNCFTDDNDLTILMTMSERVLSQSLEHQANAGLNEAGSPLMGGGGGEKGESFSLLGALSSVFSSDSNASDSFGTSSSNAVWKSLHQTVMTLHLAWISTGSLPINQDSRHDTMEIIRKSVQARCRRYLEKLYRNHSGEVVEALIACWSLANRSGNERGMHGAFDILTFLAPSAQIVVTFLCDVISNRTSTSTSSTNTSLMNEKSITNTSANQTKSMSSPGLPDYALLSFLEVYLQRLDSDATVQVWPVVSIFVKDILANTTQHKSQIFPTLRCLTIIGEKVLDEKALNAGKNGNGIATTTGGGDDRRLKRDLVDLYIRICDLNILIAGRSFEQTTWIGRRTVMSDPDSDDVNLTSGVTNDEKMSASVGDLTGSIAGGSMAEAVQSYLALSVLPSLRAFSIDSDKVIGLSTNIVYYIIGPALKVKRKSVDVSPTLLTLLIELTKLSGTYKSWRTPVTEFFLDARFFEMEIESGLKWMPVIYGLMNGDKERFVETIGRISTPSTNIFTNREAETRMRAMNIRRMSFVIFASPKDHWLTQLPLIQEKLVDLLRNGIMDPARSEVYLCLRILLLRFESKHLSNFWPVVITEMMRLFEGCLEELPTDGSDALSLVESACRFLDLLITLQTDEFQIYQWLFITDTVDIVYPPDDWTPESILDKLSNVIQEKRSAKSSSGGGGGGGRNESLDRKSSARNRGSSTPRKSTIPLVDDVKFKVDNIHSTSKRRPLLLDEINPDEGDEHATSIQTIEDLQSFFANISLHTFESTYASGDTVDWEMIESILQYALFRRQNAE